MFKSILGRRVGGVRSLFGNGLGKKGCMHPCSASLPVELEQVPGLLCAVVSSSPIPTVTTLWVTEGGPVGRGERSEPDVGCDPVPVVVVARVHVLLVIRWSESDADYASVCFGD